MISYFVLMDPEIFPDPESFKPERWIQATEQGQNLARFLVSFSKGSRACIGIKYVLLILFIPSLFWSMGPCISIIRKFLNQLNFWSFHTYSLAYAELYIAIASFVRRFDMEICETTMDNIRTVRELGIGRPKGGKISVRAKITNVIKE